MRRNGAFKPELSPIANWMSIGSSYAKDCLSLRHRYAGDRIRCVRKNLERKGLVRGFKRTRTDLYTQWFIAESVHKAANLRFVRFASQEHNVCCVVI